MKRSTAILLILFAISVFALETGATEFFVNPKPTDQPKLGFTFMKPNYPTVDELEFLTGAFLLDGQFKLNDKWHLHVNMPLSVTTYPSDTIYPDNELEIGNVNAQFQMILSREQENMTWLGFELFLGTGGEDNPAVEGLLIADWGRQQRYWPKTTSLGFQYVRYSGVSATKSTYSQCEAGLRMMLSNDDYMDETEMQLNYGYAFGLQGDAYRFGIEFLGQYYLTADGGDFADKTLNQVVLGMSRTVGNIQPRLYYLIPLDDHFNDAVGSVLGLGFDLFLDTAKKETTKTEGM